MNGYATICARRQPAKASRRHPGFHGPDTYVALVIHDGMWCARHPLRRSILEARGYEIIHCGQGYGQSSGPRSMLWRALARAAAEIASRALTEIRFACAKHVLDSITSEDTVQDADLETTSGHWAQINRKFNNLLMRGTEE